MRRQLLLEVVEYFDNLGANKSETEEYLFRQLTEELPYFPISSVHRDDLAGEGFDVSNVTDDQMQTIADKMADAYTDSDVYWIDLRIIAADCAGVPKKLGKEELIDEIKATIDTYGAFNTAEVEADASPCVYSGGGIVILAENFNEDCISAYTYDEAGMEIHSEDKPYTDLDENVLMDIYNLCKEWEEKNS
jgi:hypothetical protein